MQLKPLKGAASGELFGCPWVTQPEPRLESDWTSLEACKNGCGPTFAIQPDGAWKVVQKGRNCLKTRVPWFWLHVQKDLRCINKEFSRRLWLFAVLWIFFVYVLIFKSFAKRKCHYGLCKVLRKKLIKFIMECRWNIKMWKKWSVVNTFWRYCIRVLRVCGFELGKFSFTKYKVWRLSNTQVHWNVI